MIDNYYLFDLVNSFNINHTYSRLFFVDANKIVLSAGPLDYACVFGLHSLSCQELICHKCGVQFEDRRQHPACRVAFRHNNNHMSSECH